MKIKTQSKSTVFGGGDQSHGGEGGRGKEVRIKDKVGIERRQPGLFQNAIEGGLS